MTIELAICIVIILLGVGVYQALASVDLKPIVIKLPERKPKVIQSKPVKKEKTYDFLHEYLVEVNDHDRTKKKLQDSERALSLAKKQIPPKKPSYEITDGNNTIYYNSSYTASNSKQYESAYLDMLDNYSSYLKAAAGVSANSKKTGCVLCGGDHDHRTSTCKNWDIMK